MSHIVISRLALLFVGFIFGMSFSAGTIFVFRRHPLITGWLIVPVRKSKDGTDG